MKHAVCQELYSYWNELRGLRLAPDRGDLDPGAIRGILGDVFVLELDDAGNFRFRISGARVNALFVDELKGTGFANMWRQSSRPALADLILSVLEDTAAAVAGVTSAPTGRPYLQLEMLLLPLRHLGQSHTRLLGCLAPASVPSWLGLVASEPLTLGPMRMLRPNGQGPYFAVTSTNPDATTRRGHLRIHQGGA